MPCCRTTRSQTALEQYAASVADDSANEASNEETYESDSIQRGAFCGVKESPLIVAASAPFPISWRDMLVVGQGCGLGGPPGDRDRRFTWKSSLGI